MEKIKIALTIPLAYANKIRKIIGKSEGGIIGNYSHCSISSKVIGRFKPNEKANPHIGKRGKLSSVREEKIEFICSKDKAKSIINEIRKFHPYEELVLDIYPLVNEEDL